jgi:hypothetical protein
MGGYEGTGASVARRARSRAWFTFFLVIVGALQWRTLEKTDATLKLQQRAWLLPTGARIASAPKKNEPINFLLDLANTGREPAVSVGIKLNNRVIDGLSTKIVDLADVDVPENQTCDGLKPKSGRAIIANGISAITLGSDIGEPRMLADDRILNGDKFYTVLGCLAYFSQNQEHHSGFCYILVSASSQQQVAIPGQVSPVNGRNFFFGTCPGGFDST